MSGTRPLAPWWERVPGSDTEACDGYVPHAERSPGPVCPTRTPHLAAYRHPQRRQWVCEAFAQEAGVFASPPVTRRHIPDEDHEPFAELVAAALTDEQATEQLEDLLHWCERAIPEMPAGYPQMVARSKLNELRDAFILQVAVACADGP